MSFELTIDADELKRLLAGHTARRGTLPILEHVLLSVRDGALTVLTTDLMVEVERTTTDINSSGAAESAACCNAARLSGLAERLSGPVSLRHVSEQVVVSQEGRRYGLDALPADTFPRGDDLNAEPVEAADCESLADAIERVSYAAAKDDFRRYLVGVHICVEGVVATSGHRLSHRALPMPGLPFAVTVHRNALRALCGALRENGAQLVLARDNAIEVRFGNGRFRASLIDSVYPDWQRVIPAHDDFPCMDIDGQAWLEVVRRLMLVKPEIVSAAGKKFPATLQLASTQEGFCLHTTKNNASELAPGAAATGWPDVALTGIYLADMLKELGGPARWYNGGPSTAQVFLSEDDNQVDVIMPVRI